MKNYKDAIKSSMDFLAEDPKSVFIGYGVRTGTKGGGFFSDIPEKQLIETPIAEGLMLSMAIGLSLEGYKPLVFYERFDFIMNAMDALVNHLDKMSIISKGEYSPKVIIRCVVGGKESPFFTGVTHKWWNSLYLSPGLKKRLSQLIRKFMSLHSLTLL